MMQSSLLPKAYLAWSRSHLLHLVSVPCKLAIELLHLDLQQPGLRGHSVSQLGGYYSVSMAHLDPVDATVCACNCIVQAGFRLAGRGCSKQTVHDDGGKGRDAQARRGPGVETSSPSFANLVLRRTEHVIGSKQTHARLSFVPRHHPANDRQSHVCHEGNLPRTSDAQF